MAKNQNKNSNQKKLTTNVSKPIQLKKVTTTKKNNKSMTIPKSQLPKKKKKKKSILGKILNFILSLLMLIGITLMIAVIAFAAYIVSQAPAFDTNKLYSKEATIFYDKNGDEILRAGSEQRELKSYDELPEVLIDALVATEDSRFFQHNGFDVVRFIKASLGQVSGQEGAGGASTLTMQLAKNTFTKNADGSISSTGWKGIVRKFTDIYMAVFQIEKNYTKEQIIEFYVNSQFLGQNTYGVEQASQKYFGKSVSDLTLTEAAILVGIFNSPSLYNPYYSTTLSSERRDTVLDLMVRHGYITEEQAEEAKSISVESLITEAKSSDLSPYQTFIDVVANEVEEKTGYDPYETPMLIYTTMDPDIQDVMTSLNDGSLGYEWKTYKWMNGNDYIQVGIAVTDVETGALTAVNGGRNQTVARGFNRATMAKRQPGSTAKPIFAYGPYIEYNNGSTGTIFYDNPMTYSNGQALKNSDGKYMGAITMRTALIESRNIPAIQAFQAVDKDKIAEFVNGLGIDYCQYNDDGSVSTCELYESYAIGGGLNVSPLDMAAAYGAFARGGYYIEPYSFTKAILRETDEVAYEHQVEKVQVMSEETAYMITDMLVSATKNGVGGSINVSGTEIASKTGTSTYDYATYNAKNIPDSASADNWVITYSPDYVISMWYGVDEATSESYTNAIAAAIERKKISALLANKIYPTNSTFEKPSGIVSSKYEKGTNPFQLPSEYTPSDMIGTELFKKGTEPSEVSERYSQLANPTGGDAEVNGTQIKLSWNGISTPNAISQSYLESFFNEYYGQFATTYLNKRITYNNSYIGTIGYQVYLETDGELKSLGYTSNTNYTYTTSDAGTYKFIIKSAYSIFKSNMSSGLTISASVTSGSIPDEPSDDDDDDQESENNSGNVEVSP